MAEIKKTKIDISDGALIPERGEKSVFSAWRISFFGALASGMSRAQAMTKIILPQTIKVVLPPVGNEFIALLMEERLNRNE